MAFYDIFERLCHEKGVTPTQAGRDNGIAQGVISMWKKRGSTPKAETIRKLADYFGVNSMELMESDISAFYRIREQQQHEQQLMDHILHEVSAGNFDEHTLNALSRLSIKWSTPFSAQFYEHMSRLNDLGRKKVEDYAADLTVIPHYLRQYTPQPPPPPPEGTDTTPAAKPTEGPQEGG